LFGFCHCTATLIPSKVLGRPGGQPRPAGPRYAPPAPASPLGSGGLSPVWMRVWIFRAPDWVKHFPHWLQWGNPLPQKPQEYGLSPSEQVCMRRLLCELKALPHSVQRKPDGFSEDLLKAWLQIGHLKGFFSMWAFWWAMSSVEFVKWRSHT
uniref:Uncharacterized protein n=1 Tax=Stegastes partitus TaxID=144197 RepID=A0A3B5B6Z3_9TELE